MNYFILRTYSLFHLVKQVLVKFFFSFLFNMSGVIQPDHNIKVTHPNQTSSSHITQLVQFYNDF